MDEASTSRSTPSPWNMATWTRSWPTSKDLRPQVPQIAQVLPQPVTAAEVLSVEVADAEGVALIRYSGDTGEVTIRSRWREEDGRPVIVAAEPEA